MLFLLWLTLACNPFRYPGPSPASIDSKLYVADTASGTVSVIDLETSLKYREIWVGSTPHGLAISPDHQRLYVTVESSHLLREIDTETDQIIRSVRLTGRPHQLAVTASGRSIYVALFDSGRVEIVDRQTLRVTGTVRVGSTPHNCFVPAKGSSVFVTSIRERLVHQIDPASGMIKRTIYFSGEVRPIAVDSREKKVYAALEGLHGFAVGDIDKRQEIRQYPHPLPPPDERRENAYLLTHGLTLSPDEQQLWVTSFAGQRLLVFRVDDEPVLVGTVKVGVGPNWLTFHPNGRFLYAANSEANTVSIVDTVSLREIGQIAVGPSPKRLLVAQLSSFDAQ